MYTLREVCQKMGCTRKALRGYEMMNLLKPTEIAPNGQWMYDEQALRQLSLIQIFTEAGYTRKQIKAVLDQPKTIYTEMEKVVELLEEKKKHIEGFITTLQFILKVAEMPQQSQKLASALKISSFTEDSSFADQLKDMIHHEANKNEEEKKELLLYTPLATHLLVIATNKDLAPEDPEIQAEIEVMLQEMLKVAKEETDPDDPEAETLANYTLENNGGEMAEEILEEMTGEDAEEDLNTFAALYGEDGVVMIIRALEAYAENHRAEKEINNIKEDT